MVLRVLFGAFTAAVVLMVWGMLFWVVSGIPKNFISEPPGGDKIGALLKEHAPEGSGVYYHPNFPTDMNDADALATHAQQHKSGPLFHLFYQSQGTDPTSPAIYAQGFAHFFLQAVAAALLLSISGAVLKTFGARYRFVVLIGLILAVATLGDAIWFYHPWNYRLMIAGFVIVGWLLAGIALAFVVKHPARSDSL